MARLFKSIKMKDYLVKKYDSKTDEIAFSYDDLPMWSSVPGNLLLENIDYGTHKTIVDIGFGAGFPLIQLAHRFGNSCNIIGIELWENAIKKAEQKIKSRGLENITILNNDASNMNIDTASVDIITSNLGINNFEKPIDVIKECHRILKKNGVLYLSSNLIGTFAEFYQIFQETAFELEKTDILENLETHINNRQSNIGLNSIFESNEFEVIETKETTYQIKYADGTAFLNDYFTIMCFLPSWKELLSTEEREYFFSKLESNLNKVSRNMGGLNLTVPIVMKKIKKRL